MGVRGSVRLTELLGAVVVQFDVLPSDRLAEDLRSPVERVRPHGIGVIDPEVEVGIVDRRRIVDSYIPWAWFEEA